MKLLITGKNGQVGFELQRALAPLGEVIALDRSSCDLTNPSRLRELIEEIHPDVIVNAAAYTAVDRAETDRDTAWAINAHAPGVLGEAAARLNALVVHYSTDYVFDGTLDRPYTETDIPHPTSVYGASKLAGEQALQASGARHLIFRTSWVVGSHGGNFAKTMLRLAAERDQLSVVNDQIGAPTSAALIADITAHAIRHVMRSDPATAPQGVFHLTAQGQTHWHAYACHVIEHARAAGYPVKVTPDRIAPVSSAQYPTAAQRPMNSRLNTDKLQRTFDLYPSHWTQGVDLVLQQIL